MKKLQVVLLTAIIAVVVFSAARLILWNRGGAASPSEAEDIEDYGDFDVELLDQIYELSAADIEKKTDDGRRTILCLGNDSFAWDYEGGMSAALSGIMDADIVNGAFPGSLVSGGGVFDFVNVAGDVAKGDFSDLEEPARQKWEENYNFQRSFENLSTTDYYALDEILIFYDAGDYLNRRSPYNPDEGKTWADEETVAGALSVGIGNIRAALPHVRVVLITPYLVITYTPEGSPIAADRYDYGHGKLDAYIEYTLRAGEHAGVTVLDNYHGMTEEDNSNGYLADSTHLSAAGCEAAAQHIARVLK